MRKALVLSIVISLLLGIMAFNVNAENAVLNELEDTACLQNGENVSDYYVDAANSVASKIAELDSQKEANNALSNVKIYSTATDDEDFDDSSVMVSILHDFSIQGKEYTVADFGNIDNILAVENIMKLEPGEYDTRSNKLVNYDGFVQILSIKLKKTGKENVISLIKEIEKLDFVKAASPNYYTEMNFDEVPNDTRYSEQYAPASIGAETVWESTMGRRAVRVGVMDSGIANHSDLEANVDRKLGRDFVNENNITTDDAENHGTSVAGVIAAVANNDIGISGIAPNVTVVPLQAYDYAAAENEDKYSDDSQVAAINHAKNNDIFILNVSFGGYASRDLNYGNGDVLPALNNYNGVIVCSAGNEGLDNDSNNRFPTNYNLYNLISVAATDQNDNLASFSNFGQQNVDLAAPGYEILTTTLNNDYDAISGTSLAAPHVSAAVALLLSHYPEFSASEIVACILASVDKVTALNNRVATGGRLNIANAFDYAAAHTMVKLLSGDFNGDDKDDIAAVCNLSENSTQMRILANLSNGSKFTGWRTWYGTTNLTPLNFEYRLDVGDVNGDGKDDIVGIYRNDDGSANEYAFVSDGAKFTASTWHYWSAYQVNTNNILDRFAVGDYNGDGKADTSFMYRYLSSQTRIFVQLSSGSAFGTITNWLDWDVGAYDADCVGNRFAAGDFNNDSKSDLVVMYDEADTEEVLIYVYLSTSTAFTPSREWRYFPEGYFDTTCVDGRFDTGDFNGDGKDDLAVMYVYPNYATKMFINVSDGIISLTTQTWYDWAAQGSDFDGTYSAQKFVVGNFNGDRYDDVAYLDIIGEEGSLKGDIYVMKSNGTTFSTPTVWESSSSQ